MKNDDNWKQFFTRTLLMKQENFRYLTVHQNNQRIYISFHARHVAECLTIDKVVNAPFSTWFFVEFMNTEKQWDEERLNKISNPKK